MIARRLHCLAHDHPGRHHVKILIASQKTKKSCPADYPRVNGCYPAKCLVENAGRSAEDLRETHCGKIRRAALKRDHILIFGYPLETGKYRYGTILPATYEHLLKTANAFTARDAISSGLFLNRETGQMGIRRFSAYPQSADRKRKQR